MEKLVGQAKLECLLDEEIVVPEVTADLLDDDLQAELTRLQQKKAQSILNLFLGQPGKHQRK